MERWYGGFWPMWWRTLILAPVLVTQAVIVMLRASRLPEAAGPRSGTTGQGPELRLLVLGDSSAAGVGVSHQDAALADRLCATLGQRYRVSWRVIASSGATVSGTLATLEKTAPQEFDLIVVALGVNDAKNGVSFASWRLRYATLLDVLDAKFAPDCICVSGVPPLQNFPLLPAPLGTVIGARATRFDAYLAELCAAREGVYHLPFDTVPTTDDLAADGFHPNARVYAEWADRVIARAWDITEAE